MRTNYHTHTLRCNHAKGSDRAYVEAAIKGGYKILGFSDHTPWPFANGYVSNIRMDVMGLDEYVTSIRYLKNTYKEDIDIKVGLECEYYIDHIDWLREQKERLQLDYLILGNHFPYNERYSMYSGEIYDHKGLKLYSECAIEAMQTGLYECFAHPELCIRSYSKIDDYCTAVFREMMVAARELGVVVEFNVQMPYKHKLWQIVAEEQPKVIVGIDAHTPQALQYPEKHFNAQQILESIGIKAIDVL